MSIRKCYFLVFSILVTIALAISFAIGGNVPFSGIEGLWFYSGFLMMLFAMFYIEPYYSAPKNTLSHSIAVLLVLVALGDEIKDTSQYPWWIAAIVYTGLMLIFSWSALILSTSENRHDSRSTKISEFLKVLTTTFGQSRILYSIIFLLLLPRYHSMSNPWVIVQLVFWWILIITNPASRIYALLSDRNRSLGEVGIIFSVQSNTVFLARGGNIKSPVCILDLVRFPLYSS